MAARVDLVSRIEDLSGGALQVYDFGDGWPALGTIRVDGDDLPVAIFASTVGLSHRSRDDVERRFQNPANGTPLRGVSGHLSLLLGLWEGDPLIDVANPVIVLADADRRDDGRITRWSVFASLTSLQQASEIGWARHLSDSFEVLRYFTPELIQIAALAYGGAEVDDRLVQTVVGDVGAFGRVSEIESPTIRLRRVVSVLIRDARFSGAVLQAYGRCCAMCGIGLSLVQGAHIYPASAPRSVDDVSNGLALCANHHLAFDRHLVAVDPLTFEVVFRPEVLEDAQRDQAVRTFVESTLQFLNRPAFGHGPDPQRFVDRYTFFADEYAWL